MERIVFLDRASIDARLREPAFEHEWRDHPSTAESQVVERLAGATVAVSNKVALRRTALEKLAQLRHIAVCATGTNNVDLDYCRERGLAVSNVREYARHAVPEHVFLLILALRRNLPAYQADVAAGRWQTAEQFCLRQHSINDLHGSTLGVIGRGSIGSSVARLATAFGMKILLAEHKGARSVRAGYTAFDTVLAESDVITLHLPLTPETENLIGAAELARMKSNALLINAARGGLVDEHALVQSLKDRKIAGAGFDVLTDEPPRSGNPLLDARLPNLIVTPHNAWASAEAMQLMADDLIDNIESFQRGESRNRVV